MGFQGFERFEGKVNEMVQ